MKSKKAVWIALAAALPLLLIAYVILRRTVSETPALVGGHLMEDVNKNEWYYTGSFPVFGSPTLKREQVRSVTFLSNAADAPADGWDVSQARDGSVIAWAAESGELYDLFIASDGGVIAPENCEKMFCAYDNMESIAFNSAFDTSYVMDMGHMFYNCEKLTALDLSGFDTSHVTDMGGMFSYCESLTALDVSGFDTSHVTDMGSMFDACQSLTAPDVSAFDTSYVIDMSWMFCGCKSLTALDVSGFDTSHVIDMNHMFHSCVNLNALDLSGFDTSHVTDMSWMFSYYNLKSLDVSGFDTSHVTDMSMMFYGCENLAALDVSGFDTSHVKYVHGMFYDCPAVTEKDISRLDLSNAIDADYITEDNSVG